MGELIPLQEYKEKKLNEEVEDLKRQLEKIIAENDICIENLPYFDYNLSKVDFTYMVCVTPPDFY